MLNNTGQTIVNWNLADETFESILATMMSGIEASSELFAAVAPMEDPSSVVENQVPVNCIATYFWYTWQITLCPVIIESLCTPDTFGNYGFHPLTLGDARCIGHVPMGTASIYLDVHFGLMNNNFERLPITLPWVKSCQYIQPLTPRLWNSIRKSITRPRLRYRRIEMMPIFDQDVTCDAFLILLNHAKLPGIKMDIPEGNASLLLSKIKNPRTYFRSIKAFFKAFGGEYYITVPERNVPLSAILHPALTVLTDGFEMLNYRKLEILRSRVSPEVFEDIMSCNWLTQCFNDNPTIIPLKTGD